jgi:hypothetical protein
VKVNGEKDMFELMLDRRSAAEAGKEKEFEWGMFSVEVCPLRGRDISFKTPQRIFIVCTGIVHF